VDDPDAPAGTWVHWVLYDIPATVRELARDVPSKNKVPGVGTQGGGHRVSEVNVEAVRRFRALYVELDRRVGDIRADIELSVLELRHPRDVYLATPAVGYRR